MDKVLVHRGFSTLDVIAVAFVIVTLFEVLTADCILIFLRIRPAAFMWSWARRLRRH